jgi:hypothetical protein
MQLPLSRHSEYNLSLEVHLSLSVDVPPETSGSAEGDGDGRKNELHWSFDLPPSSPPPSSSPVLTPQSDLPEGDEHEHGVLALDASSDIETLVTSEADLGGPDVAFFEQYFNTQPGARGASGCWRTGVR